MTAGLVTLDALQDALASCMFRHPPEGSERRLHDDADRLADLFGLMVYRRIQSVPRDQVAPDVLALLEKWGSMQQ